MKIAVLSGKGGTGKTFLSVNLASCASSAVYLDCDVEEPNGRLFFKPEEETAETVCRLIPEFDREACTGCRKCVDFCRLNALAFIRNFPKVFTDVCHSCGGCLLVCPAGAVTEKSVPIGQVLTGTHRTVKVVSGLLNIGEGSGIPVIRAVLDHADPDRDALTVIDCPPGSACSVTESISEADYCILAAEPTAFGLHNFRMVCELANVMGKPCGVIINKAGSSFSPLDDFCREQNLPVLARIPYREETAAMGARAQIASEQDPAMRALFCDILDQIRREVRA